MTYVKKLGALCLIVALVGCSANGYQIGDVSKTYCASTDKAFRQSIKDELSKSGVYITVDYCAAFGLVDAMASIGNNN